MATTMIDGNDSDRLDALFPLPSLPPPVLSPQRLPGVSHESSSAVATLLKDNHARWHIFFNDKGFHNHAAHFLLAIYQLGATPALLEAAYESQCATQRPAYKSPSALTEDNLYEHLGDEDYYNTYMNYFASAIRENGISAVLEQYLFSPEANKAPRMMLNRFLSGVLHPIIHVGYGCEFGLPGMVAEGLGQLCVQPDHMPDVFPASLFGSLGSAVAPSVSNIAAALSSVGLSGKTESSSEETSHALAVLAKVAADPAYAPSAIGIPVENPSDETMLANVLEARGSGIFGLASEWGVDGADKDAVHRKIEELNWMNVVLYGVGGWAGRHSAPGRRFNADFFFLHLVTSVLFLHSYVPYLSPRSISILLRAYMSTSLAMYVARGRPALPIRAFYASTTTRAGAPGPAPTPHQHALTADPTTSAWFAVLQSTLAHNDDHLAKLQRALVHFATLYGATPAGRFKGVRGLDGAEVLDGSLFLRVAALSQDRIGWMREGEENKGWDFHGFFD
ncbi:hypothetical protein DAEQUDRAFT_719501 [Daedalea quercina L-15889]|uniref:Oxidoreductase AflY n=1 Tax=Daedalea quercina L-15889 TaxID=1314783 RepID=A0A165KNE7_9APHY|nr:hypothetical protein DAEQUDRAFT_719501 [Daedalea quercina L-15889]